MLKSLFSANKQRVSITKDTWTSIQNVNYMAFEGMEDDDELYNSYFNESESGKKREGPPNMALYNFVLLLFYELAKAEELGKDIKNLLVALYDIYNVWSNNNVSFRKLKERKLDISMQNEVERYLSEATTDPNNKNFDILSWWKLYGTEYPTLSQIARDILAVLVSTVASESAFRTGCRVLDAFRSSLPPKTVEALICTQN
ncbi:hypothetical protein Ddye_026121 [Dipteronia dyeriana]|uniref:HAT C-terminal dimerisation domain-containing protein n=1 Tax=Dipteronia dyeriana TaxID=168575 RepID=A0AAD9WP78_9ROSI|nr:hypothetical protein Ddye_026121 [Dipteronia dyeriana]